MKTEQKWGWAAELQVALWIIVASVAMGSFVSIAHFQDFGPPILLGVGETVLSTALVVGIFLGLLFSKDEITVVIGRGILASVGAYVFILITVFAPILTGIVPDITYLGGGQLVRAALLTAIFILPLNLLGSVSGRLLGEWFKASSGGLKGEGLPDD